MKPYDNSNRLQIVASGICQTSIRKRNPAEELGVYENDLIVVDPNKYVVVYLIASQRKWQWPEVGSTQRGSNWIQKHRQVQKKWRRAKPKFLVQIEVGRTSYHLNKVLKTFLTRLPNGQFRFGAAGLSPRFVGEGASKRAARRDFFNTVHSRFQALCRLRPFQMNKDESLDWETLENNIDVPHYWAKTPVQVIETGMLKEIDQDGGRTITWIDGRRVDRMPLDKLPPEFAAFSEGQWFESLTVREPRTYELRELSFVKRITRSAAMTDAEMQVWLESLPISDLPPAKSSWKTL